jgi:hypothetical protein
MKHDHFFYSLSRSVKFSHALNYYSFVMYLPHGGWDGVKGGLSKVSAYRNYIVLLWSRRFSVIVLVPSCLWKSCFLLWYYKFILAKMAEFLRHEKNIYHTEVRFWIMISSHLGRETTARNVSTVHFIIITYCFISGIYTVFFFFFFFWKKRILLVNK